MKLDEICSIEQVSNDQKYKTTIARLLPNNDWIKECYCRKCNTHATHWVVGKARGGHGIEYSYCFAYFKDDQPIVLTFDHIWPRSLGGRDAATNGQILCELCNTQKENNVDEELLMSIINNISQHISEARQTTFLNYVKNKFPHIHSNLTTIG